MRNRARSQLGQVCLLHGVRIVEKGNRWVAELDLHVLEIVELLVWLVVVSMLGMPRKENGYSTLLISHRRGRGASIIELAQGGGSSNNHHSVIINSPLVGLQHTFDIRVKLGIKEGSRREHIVADNSTESKKSKLLGSYGGTPNPLWEKCSIQILILEQTFIT